MNSAPTDPGETWITIPGYDPYQASSEGRIRNSATGRILKQWVHHARNGKEYLRVDLGRGAKNKFVHRLVCAAFHEEAPIGMECVGHSNDDGLDNRSCNLSWCSNNYNQFMRGKVGQSDLEGVQTHGGEVRSSN